MAIKYYKPTTPGRRATSVLKSADLTKVKRLKSLTKGGKNFSGRNNTGRITVRHQGGGYKKMVRSVDFKRDKFDIPGKVEAIEYDPNRNARLARVIYKDGERRYIISPADLKVGDSTISSKTTFIRQPGSCFPLAIMPPGSIVYSVELTPGRGGVLARAAGSSIILQVIEGEYAQLKMPSGEIRLVNKNCSAVLGQVSNSDFRNIRWGKAGRMRHRGIKPTVRGKAMNPVDHPHGGGEGSNPIGLKKGPMNVYGKKAYGVKTRKTKKISKKLILQRRKTKR